MRVAKGIQYWKTIPTPGCEDARAEIEVGKCPNGRHSAWVHSLGQSGSFTMYSDWREGLNKFLLRVDAAVKVLISAPMTRALIP